MEWKNGETALSSMLASCSPGIAVMNIDNGYGAAMAAVRIIKNFLNTHFFLFLIGFLSTN